MFKDRNKNMLATDIKKSTDPIVVLNLKFTDMKTFIFITFGWRHASELEKPLSSRGILLSGEISRLV